MSDVASYAVRDGIAVITMDNPPVNGLGNALRAGLMDGLNKADADPAVKGVVIIGSARFFSGGADIREFNQKRLPPDLPDVNDRQDAMKKPLVAAIGGFALGGGLELALACHYRVAAPKSQVGLPEVKLGILPGSGGTQRLPRIVPMAEAVRLMTSGAMLPVEKAQQYGRTFHQVGRFTPTSQTCSACGAKDGPKLLQVRSWQCGACGTVHDRDVNAARNVLAAGRAERLNACGGTVRPGASLARPSEPGTHRGAA